ncbi:MAG: hypothetical protein J6Y99_00715 [Bacteroidales bacterium]|nr:hypothetical protein [Bacteroidales bacterium]
MKRLFVFLGQLSFTFWGMIIFFSEGGDGPGTPLWFCIDTLPVFILSFVFFLISLFLQQKSRETRIVMSSIFLFFILVLRGWYIFSSFSSLGFWWAIYFLLNPALPELLYLLFQIKQKPVKPKSKPVLERSS